MIVAFLLATGLAIMFACVPGVLSPKTNITQARTDLAVAASSYMHDPTPENYAALERARAAYKAAKKELFQ